MSWEVKITRIVIVLLVAASSYHLRPFGLSVVTAAAIGIAVGLGVVLLEIRLEHTSLRQLIGATFGATCGILCATLISHLLSMTTFEITSRSYIQLVLLLAMGYVGLTIGWTKGNLLNLTALGGLFASETQTRKTAKILDTSVIIDGRIADICETGFVEGALIIPQFVLRELQQVADSSDSMKRNRGRRGLDILHRMQEMSSVQIQVVEDDFPQIREVDLKLIELAKKNEAKIITNDFNLNKVAQLQSVPVLNINDLANTMKPVVLPGEVMRVFILKEGKEYNQGVAYLDDGTMVVVDNARRMISKTIDISVTSVLQTTAGKMIFGKYDDRQVRAEQAS